MITATALETVRDVFAVIGALGTVGALGWRAYTWRHERQTRLVVKVAWSLPTYGPNHAPGDWKLSVTATNKSDHPIRVTSAGLELPDGRTAVPLSPPFPGALPREIAPRDEAMTWIEPEDVEAQGTSLKGLTVTGFVLTPVGRFTSEPFVIRD